MRTHTSNIQVRAMSTQKPPFAFIAPGAVFRRDDDATHSPMFHQLEAFLVAENVSFANLRGVLAEFKVPKHIHFVDELPKNTAGKLLKRDLRDRYAARS